MTQSKHTQGPWEIVDTVDTTRKNIFGRCLNNEYHVGTLVGGSKNDVDVLKANAALIAAAPDLLEAALLQDALHKPNSPERDRIMKEAGYIENDAYDAEYTYADFVADKRADAIAKAGA